MDANEKFEKFLESLKNEDNKTLIEAINSGFSACFEAFDQFTAMDVNMDLSPIVKETANLEFNVGYNYSNEHPRHEYRPIFLKETGNNARTLEMLKNKGMPNIEQIKIGQELSLSDLDRAHWGKHFQAAADYAVVQKKEQAEVPVEAPVMSKNL